MTTCIYVVYALMMSTTLQYWKRIAPEFKVGVTEFNFEGVSRI